MSAKSFCQDKNEILIFAASSGNKKSVEFLGVFFYSSKDIPIEKSMSLWGSSSSLRAYALPAISLGSFRQTRRNPRV